MEDFPGGLYGGKWSDLRWIQSSAGEDFQWDMEEANKYPDGPGNPSGADTQMKDVQEIFDDAQAPRALLIVHHPKLWAAMESVSIL